MDQLQSPSWTQTAAHLQCPCARTSLPRRPTWSKGTRHRAAQITRTCNCKHVLERNRPSTHRPREDPAGIPATMRAQAAARESCPRQWREQQQHAHCAQQTRPVLLFRTAAHVFTLTVPRWVVRSALRVVVVNLLHPCRLAADRAADGLLERCGLLVTVDLQHDAQYVTARLPDVEEVAPQRSAWRARQHEALDASLNHHPPALESPRGFFAFLPWAFLHSGWTAPNSGPSRGGGCQCSAEVL